MHRGIKCHQFVCCVTATTVKADEAAASCYREEQIWGCSNCDYQSIQTIFNSIIMSKLLYASPAWSGFANKEDQQRIDSFLRKSSKSSFTLPDLPLFSQLNADISMTNFSKKSARTMTTSFTVCCHQCVTRDTTSDVEITHSCSQQKPKRPCKKKTFWAECYIRILTELCSLLYIILPNFQMYIQTVN